MKKSIFNISVLLLAIFAGLPMVSCGSDDAAEEPAIDEPAEAFSMEGLQGTWQAITLVTTGCDFEDDNETLTFNCPDYCESITFEGNTYTHSYNYSSSYELSGTFSVQENTMTFCPDSGDDGCLESSTSKIEDGKLILAFVDSDCTDTYTFEKLD